MQAHGINPPLAQGQARLPNCEHVWKKLLSLPIYTDLTNEELEQTIDAVLRFGPLQGASRSTLMATPAETV